MAQPSAAADLNLLDVKDSVIWGLAGEAGLSFELNPKTDLRMCYSGHHDGFVAGFTRLVGALPVRFGLTFEVEIGPGHGNLGLESEQGTHRLLKKVNAEKQAVFSRSGRSVKYFAHLCSGGVNPLKLRMFPPLLPAKKKQKGVTEELAENEGIVKEVGQTLVAGMSSLGVSAKQLDTTGILERYWAVLNPLKAEKMGPPALNGIYNLRSQLACASVKELEHSMYMDGYYHAAVSFYAYPDDLALGALDNLLEILPSGSRYFFTVLVPSQEEFLDSLKIQRKRTIALQQGQPGKDYESQARESDLDAIITRCRNEGERVYVVGTTIIMRSTNRDTLLDWEKELMFRMREIFAGSQGSAEDMNHRRMFLASLPFGGHLTPRRDLMLGSSAAALAPLSRSWQGTEGKGLVLMSAAKEPICFDIFEGNTPRHGIVIGTTGSGKSFAANMLLLSLLSDPKVRALVIDIGGSFKRLTEVLGGAYFDIKIDENYAVNPILPRSSMLKEDGSMDPESLGAQTSLLAKVVNASSGPARLVIEKAIERVFRIKEEPLLSDLLAVLREDSWDDTLAPQVKAVIHELLPLCEGVYSLLLSRPTKIRPFEKQITAFDLAGLKEHKALQSIMVSVIAFSINRQLADRSVKKVVIIDEAWEFFNDDQSSELISRLYRQARKQNAAILTLSQSPKEFLESKASTAMLATKYWTMALKMKSDHDLLEKFGFTDQAVQNSKSMQMSPRAFSEVMVQFGDNPSRIARIAPNSTEYWIATTNAEECTEEEALRKAQGLTQEESILAMAKKFPVREW